MEKIMDAGSKRKHYFRVIALGFSLAILIHDLLPAQDKGDWRERWNSALTQAKNEGKVVVLGPPGELIREALTQGFEKAFPGLKLDYIGGPPGPRVSRMRAERDAGIYNYDVFLGGTNTAVLALKPMGALDPIKPVLILPEVIDLKNWRDGRWQAVDKEGLYVLAFAGQVSSVLAYNIEQVKGDEVDELNELLDPKWKDKIAVSSPVSGGAGPPTFRLIWLMLGPEKAKDYFVKLRAQTGIVERDQRRGLESVAKGKYPVLIAPSTGVMGQLTQRGLKFGVLSEWKDIGGRISSSFGNVTVLNKAPHPNAAKVFINWLLTKDGQSIWSKTMQNVSRRVDVSTEGLPDFILPKTGGKYWESDSEEGQTRTPEEEKLIKELFSN
jgi:ABC-type Fe3+ transport system substrate-binding protein